MCFNDFDDVGRYSSGFSMRLVIWVDFGSLLFVTIHGRNLAPRGRKTGRDKNQRKPMSQRRKLSPGSSRGGEP